MSALDARDPLILGGYEPLVRSTARLIVGDLRARGVATPDDDVEDVMQLLRVKVWRSLGRFDLAKTRRKRGETDVQVRDRYVFMCLTDMKKDIVKRKRTLVLMIEDQAPARSEHETGPRDAFHSRYLSVTQEQTFGDVEGPTLVPNTLSDLERGVLLLLYRDYSHREIALRLSVRSSEVEGAVRGLRAKLADWKPRQRLVLETAIAG